MGTGLSLEAVLVLVAGFLLLCALASKVSARYGVPSLLFFVAMGMLAGSDGPGGIHFEDVHLTKTVGTIALALILFAGGLESKWSELRPVVWRGLSLATLGVVITAALVAAFAYKFIGLDLMPALLLGAIVSSTDAAAVFAILRTSGLKLKHEAAPLIEFESGTNDPLAAFLTTAITGLSTHAIHSPWEIGQQLLLEMPIGLAVGLAAGFGGVWLVNRLRLDYDGMYPVITIATALAAFGGAGELHGSSFLSVYVAGVVMGSRNFLHRSSLLQFHDALAWLAQIVMFVLLGLLVFPKQMATIALPGVVLALFLILIARPVAVFVSLAFTKVPASAKLFVSWAGLRGAVPIILATFPLIAGAPESE
ncbi:MAG TPA: potassium/proton antiporter, partial [Fimbriimonas sp.]|nr:potassium/proton antiporter [Fimbriimonas sp.]